MSAKINWHVLAARCAAQHPHWTWGQVCAEVGRRKRAPRTKPTPQQYQADLARKISA